MATKSEPSDHHHLVAVIPGDNSHRARVTSDNGVAEAFIEALEAATLAERTPHPTDRRALLVRLTKKGTQLAARLRAEQARAGTTLFADVPRSDLLAFRAVIEHVITRLDSGSAATR